MYQPLRIYQPGQTVDLTLYWQSLAEFDRNWTIFAHIIDADGRIWGQRDQQPADGAFPTMGWVPNEYIKDSRQIPIYIETPPGTYFIRIGLYDASHPNFERLLIGNDDHLILDTPIHVSTE